ncbi:MAG: type I-U CRISPR-associated protein Csx17 [Myxococcales bacterium]|jgi:CRISPR-associated protein Csx17|nr:type I-U CRISPR-associated protein Csx17 [Myxococcales bacterium]
MELHELRGCAPTPLAHYLKALGILRIVSEQRDSKARGFWKDDAFWLTTELSKDELVRFFLEDWAPTPMASPWNSDFWPKDPKKSALTNLSQSTTPRLSNYRETIALDEEAFAASSKNSSEDEKPLLVAKLRARLPEAALSWIDASLVLSPKKDKELKLKFPALLGSGGNDGRFEFTNNVIQRLMELMDEAGAPRKKASELLRAALFGEATDKLLPMKVSMGQFLPTERRTNPWDFVLMLEGALVFQVSAVRKLEGVELSQAAAPFAVQSCVSGYASASDSDDDKGHGEQWMPLWSKPSLFSEVRALFAEGRLKEGTQTARHTLDAALAVRQRGASRGIDAFQRYGFFKRNGESHLAVPIGRWDVDLKPELGLLLPLNTWLEKLTRASKQDGAPKSLADHVHGLDTAYLAVCQKSDQSARWQSLLIALGEAEDAIVRSKKLIEATSPIPRLPLRWIELANDGSTEFRLAVALASQSDFSKQKLGPMRAHCVPLDPKSFLRFDDQETVRVVWKPAASLVSNLVDVLERRLMEGKRAGLVLLPLQTHWGASIEDVERFIAGDVDERRIAQLARGLMAIDWRKPSSDRDSVEAAEQRQEFDAIQSNWKQRCRADRSNEPPLPLHALFRLCLMRHELRRDVGDELEISANATLLRLLASGRFAEAGTRAVHHLGIHGLRVRLRQVFGSAEFARRIAASLAFPLERSLSNDRALVRAILKPEAVRDETTSAHLATADQAS